MWVYTADQKPRPLSWVRLTGRIRVEYDEDFGGEVCALEEIGREVLEHHDDEYVYFT